MSNVIPFRRKPKVEGLPITCSCGWKSPAHVGHQVTVTGPLVRAIEKVETIVHFDCPECGHEYVVTFPNEGEDDG